MLNEGDGLNNRLKRLLMIQSLSPLALLTIIRNFTFVMPEGEFVSKCDSFFAFFCRNGILISVIALCFIWIVVAVYSYFYFSVYIWTDKEGGYEIHNVIDKEDVSLNFFMTMIIPLLIDDVGTIQGAITFVIIVVLIYRLLERTNLFYANPVLSIIGYRVYSFTFIENAAFGEKTCVGIVKGRLKDIPGKIEYKQIDGNILYVKESSYEKS